MSLFDVAQEALDLAKGAGLSHVQVSVSESEAQEVEMNDGKVNLCRTNNDFGIAIKAIHDQRQASVSGNRWNEESKKELISQLKAGVEASSQDDAYVILNSKEVRDFSGEEARVDVKQALDQLKDVAALTKKKYPNIMLQSIPFKVTQSRRVLVNSNGLKLSQSETFCESMAMFSAKDGDKIGSFNYVSKASRGLPQSLFDDLSLDHLLELSAQEVDAVAHTEPIKGDLILTPFVLSSFLGFILGQMGSRELIAGTSIFKDKVGSQVLSDKFTLTSDPYGDQFAGDAPFTGEGMLLKKGDLFTKGVLNHYLLDLYGARKLGTCPSKVMATHMSVEKGKTSLDSMIKGVKKGLLLMRFSGGSPSPNGDFSGVAKNSFLIEDGKITKPVKEVMIAGNIIELFKQIQEISSDTHNDGYSEFPWIKTTI